MASDPNGWPDPARPGYPANPERDGWHWIMTTGGKTHACFWYANLWTTPVGDGALSPEDVSNWRYLGPCLTPAEVAAAVQAEREACLEIIETERGGWREWSAGELAASAAFAIRARGSADALAEAQKAAYRDGWNDRESDFLAGVERTGMVVVSAEALAQARREGMEAAARIVDARFSTMPGIAAAIRSAAGEVGK